MIVQIISDVYTSRSFELYALDLVRAGCQVHFVLLNKGASDLQSFLAGNSIPVTHIPVSGKRTWPRAFFSLLSKLRELKPRTVHCHLHDATVLGLLAAVLLHVPDRVFTRHHGNVFGKGFRVYGRKGLIWDWLSNMLATRIVANSAVVKKMLIEREKVRVGKVSVMHYFFEMEDFTSVRPEALQAMREKYHLDSHPVIGAVARLDDWKGLIYTIDAFSLLLRDYPGAVLLIANARGPQAQEVEQRLASLPKNAWRLVTFERNVATLYRCFDIFVHVPVDPDVEAFGQVYVEALAAGAPSVFTLSGVAHDLASHRSNCWIVPYKNAPAIHEAMKELLANNELRKAISSAGQASVREMFSLDSRPNLALFYEPTQ